MSKLSPVVVNRTPFGKTGLFRSFVEYPEVDLDYYPYPLQRNFITKELQLQDTNSYNIKLNPILTEVFINKTFKSPYLNTAKYVTVQNSTIILFFDEAKSDLQNVKRINHDIMKNWLTSIVKGVIHLHLRRILHGDIKASNILVFDGMVKITDFGSSALIIGKGKQKFRTKLYTPTHRPPELWFSQLFDECDLSADIWALGCTFYELIYGEPLFKAMSSNEEYIRQMKIWCDKPSTFSQSLQISPEWNNPQNIAINKLILKMLNPEPSERPTIFDIIKDEYFLSSPLTMNDDSNKNCLYGSLNECTIVSQRLYNKSSFEDNGQLLQIYRNLKLREEDREIRMLVLCMCESFEKEHRNNPQLIYSLHIIAHILTHRGVPYLLTSTKQTILDILKYSDYINFNYVNWDRFYGVKTQFIY